MPRGRQTDILTAAKVSALAELGYSAPQIEALTGVNARTAWGILNNEASWGEIKESPVFKANRLKQKEALEAASRVVAAKALVQVEQKIESASAYQAAGIYGLLRTHERLDAGEPTQITASVNLHTVASMDKLAAMLGQALVETEPKDVTPSDDDKKSAQHEWENRN
jgi:hypothetical protein